MPNLDNSPSRHFSQGKNDIINPPYLKWNKEGSIIEVSQSLAQKCGFNSAGTFRHEFKTINNFFRSPIWESIKEPLSTSEELFDYPVIILTSNNSPLIATADVEIAEDGCCRANIKVDTEGLYKDIVEKAKDGIFVSTVEGKFLFVNPKLVEIYGFDSTEEMLAVDDIGTGIYCCSDSRERLMEQLKRLKPNEKIEDFRFIGKHKNGKSMIISKNVYPTFYNDNLIWLYGYAANITETIGEIDNPTPIFKCDFKCNIIHANKALAECLGYTQEELINFNIIQLHSNTQQHSVWLKSLDRTKIESSWGVEGIPMTLRKKSGEEIKVFIHASIVGSNIPSESGNTNDSLYLEGWLSKQPDKCVNVVWIDELARLLSSDKYALNDETQGLSLRAAQKISKEIGITYLSNLEVRQIADSINKIIQANTENNENIRVKSLFSLVQEYSLEDKIELDMWHCLQFFHYRNELLQDALTTSQVSQFLDVGQEKAIEKIKQNELLAVERDSQLLFPIWQFDRKEPSGVLEKLPNVLNALEISDIAKLSWLTKPNPVLEQRKPSEILKHGTVEDKQRVINEAYGVGRC
jgi:PAS domain S-box-containing protein